MSSRAAGGDDRSARSLPRPIALKLRWESALPVRIAELKSHVVEPPTLEGDGYRIAVYGIPGAGFKGDPKELGKPLKNLAALKREGKKDVRPVSVEVFQWEERRGRGLPVSFVRGNQQARMGKSDSRRKSAGLLSPKLSS